MGHTLTGCIFCRKFGAEPTTARHAVFDQPVLEGVETVAIPSVGSFTEGYLLISPRDHYFSIAEMPDGVLTEFARMKSEVRRLLTRHFDPPVFFEHGMVCSTNRVGACVDHAHLHGVPLRSDITRRLKASHELVQIEGLHDLREQRRLNQSYLYFENQRQEKFIIRDASVPSQYLRRVIADELGLSDLWDWAAFPFEMNARATLRALTRQPL